MLMTYIVKKKSKEWILKQLPKVNGYSCNGSFNGKVKALLEGIALSLVNLIE